MKALRNLYLTRRFFLATFGLVLLFVVSFIFPWLFPVAKLLAVAWFMLLLVDILTLYRWSRGLLATRIFAPRFSNGDGNVVRLVLDNRYPFPVRCTVFDEIPHQFQKRDLVFDCLVEPGKEHTLAYHLKPVKRGSYQFGRLNILVHSSWLGLAGRRYRFMEPTEVKVYPSFLQMRRYELLAFAPNLQEYGIKKIRKLGHNFEFEHIKNYVRGDDYRAINWKATARRGQVMVNNYQDERSQQVFSVIDKGRSMKMPFEGMTLMDYAINAALAISNIALHTDDKAGLISFQHKVGTLVPPSKRKYQMKLIMEHLYREKTNYKESSFDHLFAFVKRKITQRSLLLLFTNFESLTGMHRQLTFLKGLARSHVLVVIFFQNTELQSVIDEPVHRLADLYTQTVARKFAFEKKLIAKELNRQGIYTVLTAPQELTINTINKYLELKSRGVI